MATYKITSTGSTILADQGFMDAHHPGDYTLLDEPLPPVQPASCSAYDWYMLFTLPEMIAIHTLTTTDASVYTFMHVLEQTIAAGKDVISNGSMMLAGIAYLQTVPPASPVLSASRAAELLAAINNQQPAT